MPIPNEVFKLLLSTKALSVNQQNYLAWRFANLENEHFETLRGAIQFIAQKFAAYCRKDGHYLEMLSVERTFWTFFQRTNCCLETPLTQKQISEVAKDYANWFANSYYHSVWHQDWFLEDAAGGNLRILRPKWLEMLNSISIRKNPRLSGVSWINRAAS